MPTTATVEYQLWQAWTIADAIGALVAGAKNVSDDKIFTMAFYGYDLAIGERLLHSTHLDAMCSIYNYDRASRNVSGPFVPVILMDALTAVGKMGCIEDDTRTKFGEPSCPEGPCVPLERTGAVIRRNQLTAALHGSGIYLAVRADTFSRFFLCLPSMLFDTADEKVSPFRAGDQGIPGVLSRPRRTVRSPR